MFSSHILQNTVYQKTDLNTDILSMSGSNPSVKVMLYILCCAEEQYALEMKHFNKSIKTSKPISFLFA